MTRLDPRAIQVEQEYRRTHKIEFLYPDTGTVRRELYGKHTEFFEAGKRYPERCLMAANRSGKTFAGCYELSCHLLGWYPKWWTGRRFNRPVNVWAVGKDAKTVRDILQNEILGEGPEFGTGMLPRDAIISTASRPGTPEAIELVHVRHSSGGTSTLTFKSYDSGPESFVGTRRDAILLDEEADMKIYSECLLRTLSTTPGEKSGLILTTYMPLLGYTPLTLEFMRASEDSAPRKHLTVMSWLDVPHISHAERENLIKSVPSNERRARSEGLPETGSGSVYTTDQSVVVVDDFEIPRSWLRAYGMDFGWTGATCAIWGAWDRANDIVYITGEHYLTKTEPPIHAQSIRARGDLPGFADPAGGASSIFDGRNLIEFYKKLGLNLELADNSRGTGISEVTRRLSEGRLKVFRSCKRWLEEYRMFVWDPAGRGKIIRESEFHCMAATRYLLLNTLPRWGTGYPEPPPKPEYVNWHPGQDALRWMQ
jgi:hypothetical protein